MICSKTFEEGISMLQIALCDDEKFELDTLKSMINQYGKENSIEILIDTYSKGNDLLSSQKQYHIIFLDIEMGDSNGIDTAKLLRVNDKHVKLIYVTNYSNYQVDAFTVRAFGYVVKPITYEVIRKQLDDVIEYSKSEENINNFTFDTNLGIKTINSNDIYYFESCNHKIEIVTKERTYKISDSIANILNNYKPYGFSMPHKSFVINLKYVSSIKGYDILLTSGDLIPISQKRAVEFKTEFHSFLRNNFNLLIKR
jgi:Response regulator of the LytR/AlgR family